MTTRGNSSISPPVQISQPRHVSAIPGTPPPNQQLFTGQPPPISQGHFEFIPTPQQQGQTLLSYQAYGSAPNDLRANSAPGGRGGAPQGNLTPAGHYFQAGQNMRPPQPQQNPGQFYMNPQAQGGMRHQRPQGSTNQQTILMIPPNNMYQPTPRLPTMYHGNPSYPPYQNAAGQMMYFANSVSRPQPHMPMQGPAMGAAAAAAAPAPRQREKRIITISDPNTGRNITDDVLKNPESLDAQAEDNNVTDRGIEIRKNFTRQVAESLKSAESPPMQPSADAPNQAISSQTASQKPPFTPSQPQAAAMPVVSSASSMVRPPMPATQPPPPMMAPPPGHPTAPHLMNQQRQGMMQQPLPSQTPQNSQPRMPINVNLSRPPPQLPNNYFDSRTQPNQQPPLMGPPVIPGPPQPLMPQPQSHPMQTVNTLETSVSRPAVDAAPVSDQNSVEPPEPIQSVSNIPSRPVTNPEPDVVPQKPEPPVNDVPEEAALPTLSTPEEMVSIEQPPEKVKEIKEPSPPPKADSNPVAPTPEPVAPTPVPVIEPSQPSSREEPKTGNPSGASTQQGSKDVRKGKKNKRDFNRKEIGGSEMDAFIDRRDSIETSPNVAPMDTETVHNRSVSPPESTSVSDVKEVSPIRSSPAPEPVAAAANPPSEPVAEPVAMTNDKQASQPPAPQKVVVPETPAPPKASVPEKIEIKQTNPNPSVPEPAKKDEQKPENKVPEKRLDNGEPEKEVNKVEPVVEVKPPQIKENHQSYNDENEPPKEMGKSKGDNSTRQAEESSKDTDAGSNSKKEGKDKLQYDRAYLMELRECPSSQTKPDGLPDLDIILDRPVISAPRMSGTAPLDFTPSFFQPTPGGQRHAPPIGKSSSRGRQRDIIQPPRVIKSMSIQNDMKPLHQSEKPWKPSKAGEDGSEVKKTLEAEVLFIMNRLTPTNFERLAEEMKNLNIKTYEHLTEVVKIFFDKVTMETKFVEAYAQLCKIMSPFKVPPPNPNMKENQASFRVVMLTKCQAEFEADKAVVFEDPEDKKKKIEQENPDTPERAELIESTLYQMKLRRMRFYGNIRFIGELFKLGLLTENIMHDCIYRLLKARDDDSLLSLCQLLTTVGKELDTDKAKQRMDQYFTQMAKITEERKSRIKFTLMDVLELRSCRWIPRKEAAGPKKIQDVHKDFAQEQARQQYLQSQPLPPRNDNPPLPGSRRGSRQRQDDKNDDGWNTVGSKNIRMIDASKMKISKNIVDDNIQLGPGGGMNKQPMWSRGSHGGAQQSQENNPPQNRFSALRNDEDRRPFQRSPSRGDGGPASRGMRQGPTAGHGRGKIMSRSSTEGERRDAIANARSIMGGGRSQNSSRDNSWNREDRRMYGPRSSGDRDMSQDVSLRPNEFKAPAPPVVKKTPDMSEEEIETKAKNILEEYLNIKDLAEAKLCVQELAGQPLLHLLVSSSINDVLEQHDQARTGTGQYLHELIQARLISIDIYLKGLSEVLEFAEDMIIDIPKLWTYLAQMITPPLLGGSLTLTQVLSVVQKYVCNRNGAILLANIISLYADKAGVSKVTKEASVLKWEDFLKQDEVDSFLKDRKIEFLSSSGPSSSSGDIERLSLDLENMMRNNASNKELVAFIERSPAHENKEKLIVRALMTAIANSSRSESERPENMKDDAIKYRKDVLQKYMGMRQDLQVQALYAIQALMTQLEHPSGVIDRFFTTLYEEEVIDVEAFNQWLKSNDPQEQAGKGVSELQLRHFFIFLEQEEVQETS